MQTDAQAAPANAIPTTPAIATRPSMSQAVRAAVALQSSTAAIPAPMTPDIAAAVAAYLPEDAAYTPDATPAIDNRAWLADAANAAVSVSPRDGKSGKPYTVEFGPPPQGLTGVECVLWPNLGRACARGVYWLHQWLTTRRYMRACELSGVQPYEVRALQAASPMFATLYTRIETAVRGDRLARTEDTLHAAANGDIERTRRTVDGEGNTLTEVVERGPDMKAAALELAALDPARYGAGKLGGGASGVVINLSFSGVAWQPGAVEASVGPAAYDADEAAAVSDTEEELG